MGDFNLENKIISGKIFLICVNLKAYKENKRFCDENMNRISKNELNIKSKESKRFYELKKIFEEIAKIPTITIITIQPFPYLLSISFNLFCEPSTKFSVM